MLKGTILRPCPALRCGMPIRYIIWDDETKRRGRTIYHWANPDGSHHIHKRALEKQYANV